MCEGDSVVAPCYKFEAEICAAHTSCSGSNQHALPGVEGTDTRGRLKEY
jgi:hypothetical protein